MKNKTKLNILAIVPYGFLPPRSGGDISTFNIVNHLSEIHNVYLFTCKPKQSFDKPKVNYTPLYKLANNKFRYVNPFILFKLIYYIVKYKIDVVFLEQPWFGLYAFILRWTTGTKFVMRCNNIEYYRFRSMGKWWWRILKGYEKFVHKAASQVLFVSESDREIAIKRFKIRIQKTQECPYGYDKNKIEEVKSSKEDIKAKHGLTDEKILLFFGPLSYMPNREAANFIVDDIAPIMEKKSPFKYKIIICGGGASENLKNKISKRDDIIYAGFVPEIGPYINQCDIVLNPIISGGGVKTKVIDTLAMGKTVISAYHGSLGVDLEVVGNKFRVANDHDWERFVRYTIEEIDNKEPIPQEYLDKYDWKRIVESVNDRFIKSA